MFFHLRLQVESVRQQRTIEHNLKLVRIGADQVKEAKQDSMLRIQENDSEFTICFRIFA